MANCIEAVAPSNIALIKYWGKRGEQLPQNPSLSFTLSKSVTKTSVSWTEGEGRVEFLFEGKKESKFSNKIEKYLERWKKDYPLFNQFDFLIKSQNSFPHSAGIASSASSMASLSLCLSYIASKNNLIPDNEEAFFKEASSFARLGSGSACRSLYGGVCSWGEWREETSDLYGSPIRDLPESWLDWGDSILLVSSNEKPVSSRQGHALMENHPYASNRYSEAKKRLYELHDIMKNEDLFSFCELVEREALELHGLMMNSSPSFILMKPESLSLIEKIRSYREKNNLPLCFTLDAGPNIHLLYPLKYKDQVKEFIHSELTPFLEKGSYIDDQVGQGPELIYE